MADRTHALTAAVFLGLAPANGLAATYHLQTLVIDGATSVTANAINDHGAIAGDYTGATATHGFILSRSGIRTLPDLCGMSSCVPIPTAITDNGIVAVYASAYGEWGGFLWRNGAYAMDSGIVLGSFGCAAPVLAVNEHGFVGFNACQGSGIQYPYAGNYTAPTRIPIDYFAAIVSVNRQGDVAGTWYPFVGNTVIPSLFHYTPTGKLVSVLPAGAQDSAGGFINDQKQIAGTYMDAAGASHGFVYQDSNYSSFDIPGQAAQIIVQAIDNTGRVAGTYLNTAAGTQGVFIYNGARVNTFGSFAQSDIITVAMNNKGVTVVSDLASNIAEAYRVTCTGTGC